MSVGFSRRAFLASGASLAVAGLAGTLALRAAAAPAVAKLRNLALRRVSDIKPTARPGAEDQFSLIFADSEFRPILSQGMYLVSHPGRGRIASP